MTTQIPKVVVPGQPIAPELSFTSSDSNNPNQNQQPQSQQPQQTVQKYIPGQGTKLESFKVGGADENNGNNEGKRVNAIIATVLGHTVIQEVIEDTTPDNDVNMTTEDSQNNDQSNSQQKQQGSKLKIKEYIISVLDKHTNLDQFQYSPVVYKKKQTVVADNNTAPQPPSQSQQSIIYEGQIAKLNSTLPVESDVVLARVIKLTSRYAQVEILTVEPSSNGNNNNDNSTSPVPVLKDSGVGAAGAPSNHANLNGAGLVAGAVAGGASSGGGGGSGNDNAGALLLTQVMGATSNPFLNAHGADVGENFKGIIRSTDIRATEKDKVKVVESFKPGDIVRAEVISIGNGNNYYLSTAKNELGVVFARAHNGVGELLYAVDYESMASSKTGAMESRKVAKPF